MRQVLRLVLPLLILVVTYFAVSALLRHGEEPPPFHRPQTVTRVEGTTLKPQSYQIFIQSQGLVEPRTKSTLIPEVSGRIIEVSPALREGGFFDEGDVLLRIDPLDYETALVVAQRNVAQAEALIEQEKARAQQAEDNWKRLGKSGEPGALARREPQLAEAHAQVAAANAELAKAQRDLERTVIRAPYSGQTLRKDVDVGQVVGNGTVLAEIYADDYVEVRLPIRNEDLAFIDLPQAFRGEGTPPPEARPNVTLSATLGGREAQWTGTVVRVTGALEARSKQLFVVAQVDDPYARRGNDTPPLRIGLFVQALIEGNRLDDVFVLPPHTVRANDEVVLIDDASTMQRRLIEPIWMDDSVIVPAQGGGLTEGEILCLTRIAYPANGAAVIATVDGVSPVTPGPGGPRGMVEGKPRTGGPQA